MPNPSDRTRTGRPRRRLNVKRIKMGIVMLGAGLAGRLSSLTGITSQSALAPMLGWMLGFSAEKARATAMRATAGASIAAILGVVWRCSLPSAIHGGPVPSSENNIVHFAPHGYGWMVAALFIGATIGAIL